MKEACFGTLSEDLVNQVIETYRDHQSCLKVSIDLGWISSASVSRVIRFAVDAGLMLQSEKRSVGEHGFDRATVGSLMEKFPHATIKQVATLAGISEASVYRFKRSLSDFLESSD